MMFLKTRFGLSIAFASACYVSTGCQESSTPVTSRTTASGDPGLSIVEDEVPTDQQRRAMLAAKDALFEKLSGRLMEVMGGQGPAAAIAVCKTEADQIADRVGESRGLKIGRTGVRLRNPNNEPPAWARPLTDQKIDTPRFVTLTNGDAAALLPIKLQGQCLMCHGPKEQIAPVVDEQLAKLYPGDEATGFEEGELRGWFWIELAAR